MRVFCVSFWGGVCRPLCFFCTVNWKKIFTSKHRNKIHRDLKETDTAERIKAQSCRTFEEAKDDLVARLKSIP